MTTKHQIDKNIPLPDRKTKAGQYPDIIILANDMYPGDSVLFTEIYKEASFLAQYLKLSGFHAPIRTIKEGGRLIGWRVWKFEQLK